MDVKIKILKLDNSLCEPSEMEVVQCEVTDFEYFNNFPIQILQS